MNKYNMSQEHISEYTRIAYYYYKVGLTQEAISKLLNISRQRINRILKECVDVGIVKIFIQDIEKSNIELETALEKKYDLKGVRIIENVREEDLFEDLGKVAANYLESILEDNHIVGFSRGRSTSAVVDNMPIIKRDNITVTQLLGSKNQDNKHLAVDDIVYRFAERLQAKSTMLYAPVIVQNQAAKDSILQEDFFVEAYKVLQSCDIAMVGIGNAQTQSEYMMSIEDKFEAKTDWTEEIVGEVATHFFDKNGYPVMPPFRERIIAIELEDFLKIPIRIGVAGETNKVSAIKAAMKGKYINVLVTDLKTAQILLNES